MTATCHLRTIVEFATFRIILVLKCFFVCLYFILIWEHFGFGDFGFEVLS